MSVPIDKRVARGIAGISLWSSRHARAVVVLALLLTGVLGYGVTQVTTDVDVADVLPRGDPNTAAAHNLTERFRSTFTQQVTFQLHVDAATDYANWERDNRLLEHRGASVLLPQRDGGGGLPTPYNVQADPRNITDEVYVRATAEMVAFIQERTAFDRSIAISSIYQLINWTVAGGQEHASPEDFRLPDHRSPAGAQHYLLVDNTVKAAVLDTVAAITSPSWNHAVALFMPEANEAGTMRELGQQIMAARDAYVEAVEAGETEFTVFGAQNPPLLTVDLPVANAHSSDLVAGDLVRLMPAIGLLIMLFLFLAFRNVRAVAISFATLGIGVVWTYGTMGYLGIPLNTLNMTIVPLVMGVGIDYAIHMINEFLEHKADGAADAEAFRMAGGRAGLAMFIATLTTVLGLVVMMVSPSLLMAQLGLLSAVAIAAIYVLTISFIPAAITLLGGTAGMGSSFRPSRLMPALGRGVTKARFPVLVLIVLVTGAAVVSSQTLAPEAFGDPGKNFPKGHWLHGDDAVREEHEEGLRRFYEMDDPDVKANILAFQGPGILTPEAMAYYRAIEASLKTKDRVIDDTLRTVPFFLETWMTVKGGAGCAVGNVVVGPSGPLGGALGPLLEEAPLCEGQLAFPSTEEQIRAEVDAMFASPMGELSSLIINHPVATADPERGMAAMTFSVRADTFHEAEEVWEQVWSAVAEADQGLGGAPDGVHVAFVGNTATNFLFQDQQLPWLMYMGVAATIILAILVAAFTRDLRATLVATGLAAATSLWWLGLLPFLGIGLAVTLMLPLVFIFNIGTDYAVHLIWNLRQVGDARLVLETTGKAILFSAVTTAGAFAIFVLVRNVAVSRMMVATTLAILVIFVATILVVPAFYAVARKGTSAGAHGSGGADAGTAGAATTGGPGGAGAATGDGSGMGDPRRAGR